MEVSFSGDAEDTINTSFFLPPAFLAGVSFGRLWDARLPSSSCSGKRASFEVYRLGHHTAPWRECSMVISVLKTFAEEFWANLRHPIKRWREACERLRESRERLLTEVQTPMTRFLCRVFIAGMGFGFRIVLPAIFFSLIFSLCGVLLLLGTVFVNIFSYEGGNG